MLARMFDGAFGGVAKYLVLRDVAFFIFPRP